MFAPTKGTFKLHVYCFFVQFQTFFLDFRCEITEKGIKWTKEVDNDPKKYFVQLSCALSNQNLVEIHNTQCFAYLDRNNNTNSNRKVMKNIVNLFSPARICQFLSNMIYQIAAAREMSKQGEAHYCLCVVNQL